MSRLLMIILVPALVVFGACAGRPPSEGGDPTAEALKQEVDEAAKDLLPDVPTTLDAELTGMEAKFYERGGFGIWDYVAYGSVLRPPGSVREVMDKLEAMLSAHGYTVTQDAEEKRISGIKGNVTVNFQVGLLSDNEEVSSLQVFMGSAKPTSNGDDFAENAGSTDLLSLK